MRVEPYLFFEGRCEEAIEFYKKAVGAEPGMLMRYSDSPEPPDPSRVPPGNENKVMHASFKVGQSTVNASDGLCSGKTNFHGVTLTLVVDAETDARRMFAALSEGGSVQQPLVQTFFSPAFGMLTDPFGLEWMVYVAQ